MCSLPELMCVINTIYIISPDNELERSHLCKNDAEINSNFPLGSRCLTKPAGGNPSCFSAPALTGHRNVSWMFTSGSVTIAARDI